MSKKPNIYVDTNICRDCIRGRNKDSIHLMETVRDKKWECKTSIFSFMELIDIEKDDIFLTKKLTKGWEINHILRQRYDKDLKNDDFNECGERIKNFFEKYRFILPVGLTNEGWDLALNISSQSNLSAPDVIHLATAWQSKCNIIVSSDENLIKNGERILTEKDVWKSFKICRPNEVFKTLTKLGFKLKEI